MEVKRNVLLAVRVHLTAGYSLISMKLFIISFFGPYGTDNRDS
jgi:hypothetical protein